jgi:PAS domain S-box-containing protein
MLKQLTDEIRECLACGAEAKQKAGETPDPATKAELLKMEKRWVQLARCFGFSAGLKDFTTVHVESPRSLAEVCQDSDKRVQVRRNELSWLASIVESSDDAIISKDLHGVIMSWNKGAQQMFGYTAEEVIGKPITIVIPPDRQDEEPRNLDRIRSGEEIEHYETVRRRKDGSVIEISLCVSPTSR